MYTSLLKALATTIILTTIMLHISRVLDYTVNDSF